MFGETYEFLSSFFNCSAFGLILCAALLSPVCNAAHEFTGYRLNQFDMQGISYGSSSSVVSYDLRTLRSPYQQVKCIMARTKELASTSFKGLRDAGAGCLLIILPAAWPNIDSSSRDDILEIEEELLADRWPMPVYFAVDNEKLGEIYSHADIVSSANQAAAGFMAQWFGDGYHLVTPFKTEKQLQNFMVSNIKASLSGLGAEDNLPTIIITAHYDTGGAAPSLSYGYDSNGSGVVALLELARIISRFYSSSKTHPRYNVQFLLTGAGKYNYLGAKYWIDNLSESVHASSSVGQPGVQFVLCLDTLSSVADSKQLFGHVSKPPKDDSPLDVFLKHLQNALTHFNRVHKSAESSSVKVVHKKINLAANRLSWEHERFSIRRLPAMTLSSLSVSNSRIRETISDLPSVNPITPDAGVDREAALCNNIMAVGEALARYIYNMPTTLPTSNETDSDSFLLLDAPSVRPSCSHVRSLRQWLARAQRAAPLTPVLSSSRTQPASSFLATLHSYISTWLPNAQITTHSLDKKEPELVFYENLEVKLSTFVVKPAIYDLFVACGVGLYLGLFYLAVLKFPYVFVKFGRLALFLSSQPSIRNSSQTRLKGQ